MASDAQKRPRAVMPSVRRPSHINGAGYQDYNATIFPNVVRATDTASQRMRNLFRSKYNGACAVYCSVVP